MKRRKKERPTRMVAGVVKSSCRVNQMLVTHLLLYTILLALLTTLAQCSINFNGIPAAFGDLDLNKRTDIVVIGDDGTRVDIHYQHERQIQPPLELGFSCKSEKPVVQVYLADIDSDGNPNLLALLLMDHTGKDKVYHLKSLKVKSLEQNPPFTSTKLSPNTAYSLALNSEKGANNISNSSIPESAALKREPPSCEFTDLNVVMTSQPLLFDLDGDLRTDFMGLDLEGRVSVWKPPKSGSDHFEKMPASEWSFIKRDYFGEPHSNAFIDMNHDSAADLVLSSGGSVAYLYANSDQSKSFKEISKQFELNKDNDYDYGQSTLADINADGKIDHIIPRCKKYGGKCDIIVLYDNGQKEEIFKFDNQTATSEKYHDYRLAKQEFARHYLFPVTLRASDLDGDGYTDFVAIGKNQNGADSKNKVIYLKNIPIPESKDEPKSAARTMSRTFEVLEIPFDQAHQDIHLVTLFDINEDGKVDMLIGATESTAYKPYDLKISAKLNTQMVDACFMKVLVTNGFCSAEAGSNGQSARGPFICFELSQNDGKKMQGCAGQLSQSSHFALQQPYVIFGLGQTPHFVETLLVSLPGFGPDQRVRTRLLEQIVPDAQVIIIPKQKDNPNSWDYKMFLSPMSDLVFSTLIALAVLCLLILVIIFILHRQETLEDAAEHEEYKRHWPESR